MRRFSGSNQAVKLLEDARAYLGGLPNTYESPLMIPWSSPPEGSSRLTEYARTVIPQRLIHFSAFAAVKTYHFVDGYLTGIKTGSPFTLFGMTRCQIELLAAAYAPVSMIRSLSSSEAAANSVSEVDRALIRFIFGNRADLLSKFAENLDTTTVPATAKDDWKAVNIQTLIDKAAKNPDFSTLRGDYDRLCEYVHPNLLSNFCLTEPFLRDGHTWIRIHRRGEIVDSRALQLTVEIMAEWTDATINLVNSVNWPFGAGPFAPHRGGQ